MILAVGFAAIERNQIVVKLGQAGSARAVERNAFGGGGGYDAARFSENLGPFGSGEGA